MAWGSSCCVLGQASRTEEGRGSASGLAASSCILPTAAFTSWRPQPGALGQGRGDRWPGRHRPFQAGCVLLSSGSFQVGRVYK